MSGTNVLPRVLVNPKLYRRQGVEAASRSNISDESKRHKCPPIDVLKEKHLINSENASFPDVPWSSQNHQQSNNSTESINSPLSPAEGLSPACAAMANACSHDHDYLSNDKLIAGCYDNNNASEMHLSNEKNPEFLRPWLENKAIIRVPIPPKPPTQSSPRDVGKDLGPWHYRRVVKPQVDQTAGITEELNRSRQKSFLNENDTCIFKSTNKTAQPLRKARSKKKSKVSSDEKENIEKEQLQSSSSSRSTSTTNSEASKLFSIASPSSQELNDFDIATDKLTVEWQNLVKSYSTKSRETSEKLSNVDFEQPNGHSTPFKNENNLPIPRPSVTPCPPGLTRFDKFNNEDEDSEPTKNDSAYFSLNSSFCSVQPNNSSGTPAFHLNTSAGVRSRPSTGHTSLSSARPPSGGKRVAAESLSSTSSGSSSDDDSLCSSLSSHHLEHLDVSFCENKNSVQSPQDLVADMNNSSVEKTTQDHKVVKLRKGKKFVRQIDAGKAKKVVGKPHITPLPPRKPKKDPLPMHHRALPVSFFQEPNRVNLPSLNTLPPLQPLFRQAADDDIADLRPVTPPDQLRHPDDRLCCSETKQQVIIRRGDTDLLNRLFDAVDPQTQSSGRRVKRGRPKRPPRILPSPKLTLDDNPCIMQSITETLLPNLSIEKRHHKLRGVKGHVSAVLFNGDRSQTNMCAESETLAPGGNFDFEAYDKDLTQFGFLSFNSPNHDGDGLDTHVETSSSTVTNKRLEFLALPHLPYSQDYSQMLSDVAAVL